MYFSLGYIWFWNFFVGLRSYYLVGVFFPLDIIVFWEDRIWKVTLSSWWWILPIIGGVKFWLFQKAYVLRCLYWSRYKYTYFPLGDPESIPGSRKLCFLFIVKRGIIARDDLSHALYIIPVDDFQKVGVQKSSVWRALRRETQSNRESIRPL